MSNWNGWNALRERGGGLLSRFRGARKQRRSYRGGMARRQLLRYLGSLAAWGLLSAALGFVGLLLLDRLTLNRDSEWLRRFLIFCRGYALALYLLTVAAGWIALSYLAISRPLRYLDELVAAAEQLAAPGDAPIRLPEAMHEVENQLNLAREQSLRAMMAAREAEQRKSDLIVYLAHDLKTPLTSVIGYLTLLRDEPQISEELRAKYTGVALDKAGRLEELINEFFEITRFRLSHLELERSPVDLPRMIQQMVSEFLPMFRDKDLSCETDLPGRLEYSCDPDKLARVFENLLRNAVHYSFPRSVIHIRMKKTARRLAVAFENVGPTIPPEKLGRVFEQFFRVDGSRGTNGGGAGLGLAIAKQIVSAHGGSIYAESGDSRTVFTVELPWKTENPSGNAG